MFDHRSNLKRSNLRVLRTDDTDSASSVAPFANDVVEISRVTEASHKNHRLGSVSYLGIVLAKIKYLDRVCS